MKNNIFNLIINNFRVLIIVISIFFSNKINAQWGLSGNNIYNTNIENVGIGTSMPAEKLHIYDGYNTIVKLRLENKTTYGVENCGFNLVSDANNGFFDLLQYGKFGIKINSNEYFTILGTGLIGINNTTPTELLDISGGNIAIRNNSALNRVLTSDANGVGTWQELTLNLSSNTLTINGFSPISLISYLDNTDNQTLSLSGNTLSILNGGNVDLSLYLDNTDNQDLTLTGNTLSITNDVTTVDLSSYVNTDAQNLSITDHDLTIENGNTITLPDNVDDADADATNELITNALLNGNNLEITDAGGTQTVDLSYFDNSSISIDDADADPQNEIQDLVLSGNVLSLTNNPSGTNIDLGNVNYWSKNINKLFYNTGKVGIGLTTPASNLHLHNADPSQSNLSKGQSTGNGNEEPPNISQHLTTTFQLTNTNTGEYETDGLLIQSSDNDATFNLQENGNISFISNKTNGLYLYNNKNTGIGIETPKSTLHIHNSKTASSGGGGYVGTGELGKSGEATNETASTIQITNASTGSGENNGLFISAFEKSGIINLNEIGYFDIKMQDESAFKINSNKKVQLSTLAGNNDRLVIADSQGNLKANLDFSELSLWKKLELIKFITIQVMLE